MSKIITNGLLWVVGTILTLIFLKLANDVGGYWVNASWVMAVGFGIETVLFMQIIKEWREEKKTKKPGDIK